MQRRYALLWIALLVTTMSWAQGEPIAFEKFELENGLKVILHEDHSTPIVAVSVMYHVGSKNENPERTGFAHFFEHLLFEGSENIERGEFASYVQNAGGAWNANTSLDRTYYYEVLPANELALGLWLESERMLHAKVDQVGIDVQRDVVKEERRERIDNQPYGSILEQVLRNAYREHPYRWGVIGSMEHLEAATESDYQQFYADYYVPNNAILSIAGDIDPTATKALIEQYFGSIPASSKPIVRPQIVEPALGGEVRDTIYDNIQLPAVIMAYRTPAQGTEDTYALEMLNTLLSTGQSSRLYRSLVDEQQQAAFVGNFNLPLEDPGVSIAFGITNMGITPETLQASIDAEVRKVQDELISEREFQKIRNQLEADFVSRNGTVAGIAESLANYEMYYGDANLINTELERYLAVTREDIQRVAKQYYRPQNRVVLYYLPMSAAPQP